MLMLYSYNRLACQILSSLILIETSVHDDMYCSFSLSPDFITTVLINRDGVILITVFA